MSALAAARLCGADPGGIQRAMDTFEGLEHRVEYVGEAKGIRFFNDSKATTVDSVVRALECFEDPVLLLAGGKDKGGSFAPLQQPVGRHVRRLFLYGAAAGRMARELGGATEIETAGGLEEALAQAWRAARPGEVILLSPACSSFDMFRDYEERGQRFKALVHGDPARERADEGEGLEEIPQPYERSDDERVERLLRRPGPASDLFHELGLLDAAIREPVPFLLPPVPVRLFRSGPDGDARPERLPPVSAVRVADPHRERPASHARFRPSPREGGARGPTMDRSRTRELPALRAREGHAGLLPGKPPVKEGRSEGDSGVLFRLPADLVDRGPRGRPRARAEGSRHARHSRTGGASSSLPGRCESEAHGPDVAGRRPGRRASLPGQPPLAAGSPPSWIPGQTRTAPVTS